LKRIQPNLGVNMKIRVCKNFVVDLALVKSYGFVFFDNTYVIFNYDDEEMDISTGCSSNGCEDDASTILTENQYEKLNEMFIQMLARDASFFDAYSFVKDLLSEK
jgi:hypothetical protein